MFATNVPRLSRDDCIAWWNTIVVQFAFLFFVAFANFVVGVGTAVYLGKAPRDLQFLTELFQAIGRRKLLGRGEDTDPPVDEDAVTESPLVEPDTEDAPETVEEPVGADVASTESDTDTAPQESTPTQIGMEETIIDMSAQEEALRQIGQCIFEDQKDDSDWETLLSNITEGIQKLLVLFNEARHLVELEREIAPDACQICLDELDTQWNAINQQSMQLLVLSTEPGSTDKTRDQLSTICADVLKICSDTRQSCATYLANASLERQMVSA